MRASDSSLSLSACEREVIAANDGARFAYSQSKICPPRNFRSPMETANSSSSFRVRPMRLGLCMEIAYNVRKGSKGSKVRVVMQFEKPGSRNLQVACLTGLRRLKPAATWIEDSFMKPGDRQNE